MNSNTTLIALLLSAEVIEQNDLVKAKGLSEFLGYTPGFVLLARHLSEQKILSLALALVESINANQLHPDTAIRILRSCRIQEPYGIQDDAFLSEHIQKENQHHLGGLLRRAGLLTQMQLASALLTSELLELRLGECLVMAETFDSELISEALRLQQDLRAGLISAEKASAVLSLRKFRKMHIESESGNPLELQVDVEAA